ncbi:MAG: hypothetical protein PUP92_03390 [Rhizonema sp. PD38]|nr:hypothetical protein [Rhizonema sp. PD38]
MAIHLHDFISSGKRYIQVESQPHHITCIFRKIIQQFKDIHLCKLNDAESVYFEDKEDETTTFYQAASSDFARSGIWTYLTYECSKGKEQVFNDSYINTSVNPLKTLLAGQKLIQVAVDINEYLKYKFYQDEYLEIRLPLDWNTLEGREITHLLLEEINAFKASSIFSEDAGKEYMKTVIDKFIQIARKILKIGGTRKDFELAQYEVLNKININDMVNLIIEYNDYRLWQATLPSKSKAVGHAFNTALSLISQMK